MGTVMLRQCGAVEVDEVRCRWACREAGVNYDVGSSFGAEDGTERLKISERWSVILCGLGGGNVDVHDVSHVAGDGEVAVCVFHCGVQWNKPGPECVHGRE